MNTRLVRAAAIYCRISRDREGGGLGVARQEEDCRALATARGWPVAAVFRDNDLSAYRAKPRPEYRQMLELARDGQIDAIIAWHNDRLHREPRELEEFIDVCEAGHIAVETVKAGPVDLGTPSGRMIARQFGAIARYESEHRSERIKRKHDELARAGKLAGGGKRAYGYERDGRVVRENEAQIIREAADRVLAGDSIRSVCYDLIRRGVPSASGGIWSAVSMKNMLRSSRLSGQRNYHGAGNLVPGDWPAILTPSQTRRLQAMLRDRPTPRKGRSQPRSLLTSLVRCGRCGQPMTTHSPRPSVRNYHCHMGKADHRGCGLAIRKPYLDALVTSAVLEAIESPALARISQAAAEEQVAEAFDLENIDDAHAKLGELGRLHAAGTVTTTAWLAAVGPLEVRIRSAEARLAERDRAGVADQFRGRTDELRTSWKELSIDRQRAIIAAVIDRIEIMPVGKGHGGFDPNRVMITWKR